MADAKNPQRSIFAQAMEKEADPVTATSLAGDIGDLTVTENNAIAYRSSQPVTSTQSGLESEEEWQVLSKSATSENAEDETIIGARVDLFFHTVRKLAQAKLYKLLKPAAEENLLDTLRMMFYVRDGIRGRGKGEKALFLTMWRQLMQMGYKEHLLVNIQLVPHFGCWKDVMQLARSKDKEVSEAALSLIVERLQALWEALDKGEKYSGPSTDGLLVKWLPTERHSLDKRYKLTKAICSKLGWSLTDYRIRLTKLRASVCYIVERKMCKREWSEIEYGKVPGQAMKRYKGCFIKHDKENFENFQKAVSENLNKAPEERSTKEKLNVQSLLPHEIYQEYCKCKIAATSASYSINNRPRPVHNLMQEDSAAASALSLLELQWKTKLENARRKLGGAVSSTLCVADVSGSMTGLPMDVSVSLSLFLSQLVEGPFRGHIISFNATPAFTVVEEDSLAAGFEKVEKMDWGMDTNFEAVFDLILSVAVKNEMKEEDMPKRVIVLSDMEFNQASRKTTNWEVIKAKYKEHNYAVPMMVFWNLRSSDFTAQVPAKADEENVCLVSGFNPATLETIMECGPLPTPWMVCKKAIRDDRYKDVKLAMSEK